MKIVHVTNYYKPSWESGGVTNVVHNITKKLTRLGHDVTVITSDGFKKRLDVETGKPVLVDGVNVYYFRNLSMSLASRNFVIPLKCRRTIENIIKDADIVHINEHRSILAHLSSKYATEHGKKRILQLHGSLPRDIGRTFFKRTFDLIYGDRIVERADSIIASTEMERRDILKSFPGRKVAVLHYGIDMELNGGIHSRSDFRREHGIGERTKIILYIGRINEIKGLDLLIDSLGSLERTGMDYRVIISGPDDGYYGELRKRIDGNPLRNRVSLIGPLYGKEKIKALKGADVFVQPSKYEVFGLGPLEANGHGLPVVVTKQCGISDFIERNKTGIAIERNEKELVGALERVLLNDDERSRMGKNGISMVKNEFKWDVIVRKYEDHYRSIIQS